jgi:ribose transport system ATP-binding protein
LHLEPCRSIAEHFFLGRQPVRRFGLVDYGAMNRAALLLLDDLGAKIEPVRLVGSISTAQRQMIAPNPDSVPCHHFR